MGPKLSIITINYNNDNGLKKTIESVVGQTYKELEYIIIDGGSTDSSVDVIKEYQEKINYWLSEKDNGIYHAMNKGIQNAHGDYLLFLNSGDFLANSHIVEDVISNHFFDKEIIYGDLYLKYENKELIKKSYPEQLTFNYFFSGESLPHPAAFINKSLFAKVGLYNEELKIVSDWEFWLKALFLTNATYKKLPLVISVFEMDGICSKVENSRKISLEKEMVYNKHFCNLINDYKAFNTYKNHINSNIFVRILKKVKLLNIPSMLIIGLYTLIYL
jgi:glycosyltransferase involved in cell wall biosynthesis